jgi:hypothetical protein
MAVEETTQTGSLRIFVSQSAKLANNGPATKGMDTAAPKGVPEVEASSKGTRKKEKKEDKDKEQKKHDKILKHLQKVAEKEPSIEGALQQVEDTPPLFLMFIVILTPFRCVHRIFFSPCHSFFLLFTGSLVSFTIHRLILIIQEPFFRPQSFLSTHSQDEGKKTAPLSLYFLIFLVLAGHGSASHHTHRVFVVHVFRDVELPDPNQYPTCLWHADTDRGAQAIARPDPDPNHSPACVRHADTDRNSCRHADTDRNACAVAMPDSDPNAGIGANAHPDTSTANDAQQHHAGRDYTN